MEILPGILANNAQEFHEKLCFPILRDEATFHVDVLDDSMFNATCWANPNIVSTWGKLPNIELHLMVQNPLPHIEAWHALVPSFRRAIVHTEIARPVGAILERTQNLGIECVLALNPETPVETIEKYEHLITAALIMGVHPGKSGQPFLGDSIVAKIKRARKLFPQLTLAVDGGVTKETLERLTNAGASRAVASSAVWNGANPIAAYKSLLVYSSS